MDISGLDRSKNAMNAGFPLPFSPKLSHIAPMPVFPDTIAFMEGLGAPEMMLIFVVVLVLFGGNKLPEFARGLGKSMREFKKAAAGVEEEFKRAMEDDERKKASANIVLPPSPPPVPVVPAHPNPDNLPLEALTPENAAAAAALDAAPSIDSIPAPPLIPLGATAETTAEATTAAAPTVEPVPATDTPPPAPTPPPTGTRIRDDYA
jgi:sec-independent protein translocase protein TatA